MPTQTFEKLPEDKKEKIINAAKKEFARVSFEKTSIQNIIKDANIARGSFYQYFESKEDLLAYILQTHINNVNLNIEQTLEMSKGDIFQIYINMYESILAQCGKKEDMDFYKKIFEKVKASDDGIFTSKVKQMKVKEMSKYYKMINTSNLKVNNEKELKIISDMLFIITRKAIISSFKSQSKKEAKEEFLKQLEYIKYGVLK